jgi:hypothetical protein
VRGEEGGGRGKKEGRGRGRGKRERERKREREEGEGRGRRKRSLPCSVLLTIKGVPPNCSESQYALLKEATR